MANRSKYLRFGLAIGVILMALSYLAFTGIEESKSYYVTINELEKMGDGAYTKRLRVAGNVKPGSIRQSGTNVEFVLLEEGKTLNVSYKGSEPPPDTFKDDAQALAEGEMGRDGVFHAKKLQAKCASKYAPKEGQEGYSSTPGEHPKDAPVSAPEQPEKASPGAAN